MVVCFRHTGIVTRGRGVSVHRVNCPNAFDGKVEAERRIRVDWDADREQAFLVKLQVAGIDRRGLLADVVKAIALGADAVYIGTGALVAMGCHLCQKCYTGKCNWGIATQDPYLTKRLNPNIGSRHLSNLIRAWSLEIKEMLGGMGVNAIESLRGNRDHLRGVGLNDVELRTLGIKAAGEA